MKKDKEPLLLCVALNGFKEQWRECIESHREYASREKIKYILVDESDCINSNPKWLKFSMALQMLRNGHCVMLIDADARIQTGCPNFSDLLKNNPVFDIFSAKGRSGRLNSGVIVLRGGRDSAAVGLLDLCIASKDTRVPKEDFVTEEGENGHFIHFLKGGPYKEKLFILPEIWNKTVPPCEDSDYIVHYTGPMRTEYFRNLKKYSFRTLETSSHPLLKCFPELEYCNTHREFTETLRKVAELESLQNIAEEIEAKLSIVKPPVTLRTHASLLWRIEYATGWLERPSKLLVEKLVKPGWTVVDVGANLGYYTSILSDFVGNDGQVIALEPEQKNFERLKRIKKSNIKTYQRIVSDSVGTKRLFLGNGHSNHALYPSKSGVFHDVDSTTLDKICSGLKIEMLHFLKCDVEGAELKVLEGADGLLSSAKLSYAIFEINPKQLKNSGANPERILERLASYGYSLARINDDYTFGPVNKVIGKDTANYLVFRGNMLDSLIKEACNEVRQYE